MADSRKPLEWVYLPEFDSYCQQAGDTNYASFCCVGGSRRGDTYTLRFTPAKDWYTWRGDCETVLVKTEDGYRFCSNHSLEMPNEQP